MALFFVSFVARPIQGLNVFNTALTLADPKSATDSDYERVSDGFPSLSYVEKCCPDSLSYIISSTFSSHHLE